MTSLIRDSIATMTGPRSESISSNSTSETNLSTESTTTTTTTTHSPTCTSLTTSIDSIPILKSVQDWWTSPRSLMYESNDEESDQIKQDRLRNRQIEYELFRTILPSDIYIYPPSQDYENELNNNDHVNKEYLITGRLIDVKLDDGNFIHEFYLENNNESTFGNQQQQQHIVIIHGYMAAMGYFIKNVEDVIKIPGVRLHLIDLPGFGNSSRPKFPKEFILEPNSLSAKINQILQIENWFIDKIENWRIKRNINQFKLIGHSMGAYLSCCYLMKYNLSTSGNENEKLVSDVILVSPMGTESNEFSLINDKRFQFNLHNKIDPFQELHFENENENENENQLVPNDDDDDDDIIINEEITKIWSKLGKPKFPKNWLLKKLWSSNKSPFEFLQNFGPFYSKILSYWSFQRFKNFENNQNTIDLILKLHNYSYSIFNQFQGSGEIAITKLITPEILAKLPLADRGLIDFLVENNINNMWIYGDNDWMNKNGGEYIYQQIKTKNEKITQFKVVEKAGHHIYLDNPQTFNQIVIDFLKLNQLDFL